MSEQRKALCSCHIYLQKKKASLCGASKPSKCVSPSTPDNHEAHLRLSDHRRPHRDAFCYYGKSPFNGKKRFSGVGSSSFKALLTIRQS
jgi:hypothetical protein